MSLIRCHECREKISSTAKSCPKCGAKVPHFKWWLWVPVWLIAAFFLFAYSVNPKTPQEAYDKQYSNCLSEHINVLLVDGISKFDYCRFTAEEAKRRFR